MLACVLMLKTCIKMYLKQSIYQHFIVYIYNVSMTKMVNNKTQDKPENYGVFFHFSSLKFSFPTQLTY